MKKLIFYFFVLLAAIWLGIFMQSHPSYFLISLGHFRFETTLWLAIVIFIAVFYLVRWLIRFIATLWHSPRQYKAWSERRSQQRSQQLIKQGLFDLIEGDWQEAEKNLLQSAQLGHEKVLSFLGAAAAAQGKKDYAERDEYTQKARSLSKNQAIQGVIDIQQIRWQLASGQYTEALQGVDSLHSLAADHPFILQAQKQAYLALQDWENLRALLPKLRLFHALDEKEMYKVELSVFRENVAEVSTSKELKELEALWEELPSYLRKDSNFIAIYTRALSNLNASAKAEDLLKIRLKKSLDPQLLQEYAQINSNNPAKQLSRAEQWLDAHPKNAALLLCLGRICMRLKLWGKARNYLESAVKQQPSPTVYLVLGEVLEQLEEKNVAMECYKKGLEVC